MNGSSREPCAVHVEPTAGGVAIAACAAGAPFLETAADDREALDALVRLASFAGGRPVLVHDAARARLLLPKDAAAVCPALADPIDAGLLSCLAHPDRPEHSLAAAARRCELVAPEPGDATAAAALLPALLAGLLEHLATDVDRDALAALAADLPAEEPLVGLLRGLDARPAAVEGVQDDLLRREPRGEPAATARTLDDGEILELFAEEGPLAREFPGWVVRHAQVALARAVAGALNGRQVLLAEAGTGIGKSLAYLAPALLFATRNQLPVVIATRTKNLQSQLFDLDLPRVARALDASLTAALVKGRGDYLCLQRLGALLEESGDGATRAERTLLAYLARFARKSADGDLERLAGPVLERVPNAARIVDRVRCEHGASGRRCRFGRRCFYPRLAARAAQSHVLVANHALALSWPRAFPPAAVTIFDEAHDLVDSATGAFGVAVGDRDVRRLVARVVARPSGAALKGLLKRIERKHGPAPDALREGIERCEDAAGELAARVDGLGAATLDLTRAYARKDESGEERRSVLRLDAAARATPEFDALADAALAVAGACRRLVAELERAAAAAGEPEGGADRDQVELVAELDAVRELAGETATGVERVVEAAAGDVTWVEHGGADARAGRGFELRAAPIDVGRELHLHVLGVDRPAVLTSATLRTGGSFEFHARHLGIDRLDPARRLQPLALGSPFRYAEQLCCYVPLGGPDPLADDAATAAYAAARAAYAAAAVLGGRVLVLFNSRARMLRAAGLLDRPLLKLGIEVLCAGRDGGAARVLERFRGSARAVLLGARAFWEGVDLPGARVKCVVIERLPFETPADPVHSARTEALEAEGSGGFTGYSLPRAIIRLLQGVGRVVRSESDRGAIVLLDPRVGTNRRYGPVIRASLPCPCEIGPDRAIFARLFERLAADSAPGAPPAAELLERADREMR